jgi:hypothetical protein
MLDVSAIHPFEACAAFAVHLLARPAVGDMTLTDMNEAAR